MIVTCDQCGSRYKLDDAKITGRGARITCPSCRNVFVVFKSDGDTPGVASTPRTRPSAPTSASSPSGGGMRVTMVAASAAPAQAQLNADTLDFKKVGIASWKVKVKIGLVYDFNDLNTLRKYIQDGRVTEDDLLSHNGDNWTSIGDIPDLEAHFIRIYLDAETGLQRSEGAAETPAPTPSLATPSPLPEKDDDTGFEDEDSPTMIMGMGDLAESVSTGSHAAIANPGASSSRSKGRRGETTGAPVQTTGDAAAAGPRFVDPFEQLRAKQKRSGSSGGRRSESRSTRSRVPRTMPPDVRPSEPERSGGRGLVLGLLALVVMGGGGLVVWKVFESEPSQSTNPPPPRVQVAPPAADADETPPEPGRNAIIEAAEATLTPVEEPEPINTGDDDPILTPVIPTEIAAGGSGGNSVAPAVSSNQGGNTIQARASTAQDHAAAGDEAAARGDWATGVIAYGKAVSMDQNNPLIRQKLGVAQYRAGDTRSARDTLSQASRQGASGAAKWLGHIARDQGDAPGAIGYYQTYLNSNPSDASEIQQQITQLQQG